MTLNTVFFEGHVYQEHLYKFLRMHLACLDIMWVLSICLRNTGKVPCDNVLKAMKLRNETLLQYYHEKVISVVDRAKDLLDAELIVKLASSSVGELFSGI